MMRYAVFAVVLAGLVCSGCGGSGGGAAARTDGGEVDKLRRAVGVLREQQTLLKREVDRLAGENAEQREKLERMDALVKELAGRPHPSIDPNSLMIAGHTVWVDKDNRLFSEKDGELKWQHLIKDELLAGLRPVIGDLFEVLTEEHTYIFDAESGRVVSQKKRKVPRPE